MNDEKIDIRLPFQEISNSHEFYKNSLQHLKDLKAAIEKRIGEKEKDKKFGVFKMGFLFGLLSMLLGATKNAAIEHASLVCMLDETNAKIKIQKYHLEVYEEKKAYHEPVYKRETEETNKNWDTVFPKALAFAKANPSQPIGILVNDYVKMEKSQELKNELYKSMRKYTEQINGWYEKASANEKSKNSMSVVPDEN